MALIKSLTVPYALISKDDLDIYFLIDQIYAVFNLEYCL